MAASDGKPFALPDIGGFMKLPLSLIGFILLCIFSIVSNAQTTALQTTEGEICIVGETNNEAFWGELNTNRLATSSFTQAWQCKKVETFRSALSVISIGLSTTSLVMACTGVGAPASLTVQGVGVGIKVLDFVISKVHCESNTEEELTNKVASVICAKLQNSNIYCDPNTLIQKRP